MCIVHMYQQIKLGEEYRNERFKLSHSTLIKRIWHILSPLPFTQQPLRFVEFEISRLHFACDSIRTSHLKVNFTGGRK